MSNYVSYAEQQAEELRESLSESDIEHLRADLEQLGLEAWMDWAARAQHEANDYLRATARQRAKKKKWQDPVLRRRLTLSAYHQARLASAMLNAASQLGPGGSYRGTSAYAATIGLEVIDGALWHWPFLETPPKDWPGPQIEPYWTASGAVLPGQPQTPPEIRQGFDYT